MKLTRAMDVDAVVEDVPDTKRTDSATVNLIRLNHMLDAHRTGPLRAFYLDHVMSVSDSFAVRHGLH